ncbi:hypothetical protein JHK86_004635 [Glycine max]|nr:hypothetical protein JHK86_004635 [Glycine max]
MAVFESQLVSTFIELVIANLMYLEYMDPKDPIYIYKNSTRTTRDDGEMDFKIVSRSNALTTLSAFKNFKRCFKIDSRTPRFRFRICRQISSSDFTYVYPVLDNMISRIRIYT